MIKIDRKRIYKYAAYTATIILVYIILKYAFWTVFPFVFTFSVAFIVRKIVGAFIKVTGLRLKEASFVLLVICYVALFISIYFLFELAIKEGIYVAQNLPYIYKNEIEPIISDFFNNISVNNDLFIYLVNEIKSLAPRFVIDFSSKIANIALGIPNFLITCAVSIIASFFLCLDYDNIKNSIVKSFPLKFQNELKIIKHSFILSIGKMLKCSLTIFTVTFVELFIGMLLLRVKYPLLVAFIIAFADFLPLIGTGTILIPWAIVSFMSGNSAFSVGIIAIYLIATIIRNIIEPKILGKNIGVHPLLTLAAMYIGLKLGGVLLGFMLPLCLLLFKTIKNNKQF